MLVSDSLAARAAILAGGRGSRLGGPKAGADLGGHPLISYPLATARAAKLNPFVVAKANSELPKLDCEIVGEPEQPFHPLVGALAALRAAPGAMVLLGCDMPFLTSPLLAWFAALEPPVVAYIHGRLEPLLGVYDKSAESAFADALTREAPLQVAIEALSPRRIDERALTAFGDPWRLTFSVNTPDDLALAAGLLAT